MYLFSIFISLHHHEPAILLLVYGNGVTYIQLRNCLKSPGSGIFSNKAFDEWNVNKQLIKVLKNQSLCYLQI